LNRFARSDELQGNQGRRVAPVLKTWLSAAQQAALDQLAPERIKLPNIGRQKFFTPTTSRTTIAVRIQDLYGVAHRLTIGNGRVALRIECWPQIIGDPDHRRPDNLLARKLSENQQELQRKYPKHEWR
jgi:ATP-dependent helicase HrpB